MTNQNKAFLYAVLTVLMWSTIATALKLALASLAPIPLILVAMGTALLILGFLLLHRGAPGGWADLRGLTRGERLNILIQGGILFCYYNLLLRAFGGLPAQVAQPINSTWALVLALLSAWALRQRLSLREFLWMLFAYTGVVIVAAGGSSGELGPIRPLSLVCVLGSTLLNAVYWLLNAKNRTAPLLTLFLSFSVSFLLAPAVFVSGRLSDPSAARRPALARHFGRRGRGAVRDGDSLRAVESGAQTQQFRGADRHPVLPGALSFLILGQSGAARAHRSVYPGRPGLHRIRHLLPAARRQPSFAPSSP